MPAVPLFDAARVQAPHLAAIRAAIERVLASGRLVLGPEVARFEEAFARYCGVAQAIGVANGSDALELALRAVGVGAGDRVVAVANAGGYATVAIRACGGLPLYAEIDPETLLMDAAALAPLLAWQPRAVIVTHLYGRLAAVEAIAAECAARGIALIEDCAQAHGAQRGGRRAGSFGVIGCFSFYPTKNLGALGDGGALITNDPALAARLRALRQYGWESKYHVTLDHGRNSRLDEIQAAILMARLPHLDAENARRRAIARACDTGLQGSPVRPLAGRGGEDDVVHLYLVRHARREALREHLTRSGVGCDVHYPVADHLQPAWRAASPPALPATEQAVGEILTLPCHPAMTDEEVQHVIAAVRAFG